MRQFEVLRGGFQNVRLAVKLACKLMDVAGKSLRPLYQQY